MKTNNYLTTKEFIKAVEELGLDLKVECENENYFIIDVDGDTIAYVNKTVPLQISTDYNAWDDLCDEDKKSLFKLLMAYASTPPDERGEEKKCHWQHRWMDGVNGNFLNLDLEDDYLYLDDKKERWYKKTTFTQKEIDEIKEKYNTDLSDFERVEVEE